MVQKTTSGNTIYMGLSRWKEDSQPDAQGHDVVAHEIAHIVEFATKGIDDSPAWEIWGDSKWAEIYQYDVDLKLGWTADAQSWYKEMIGKSDSFPRPNTYWFRDWFYPIYRDFGETTVLNNFFSLLATHFPKNGQSYACKMNLGELVHFWSGAAKQNLRDVPRSAFGPQDRNRVDWVARFDRARQDFPGIQYRLIPVRPPAPPALNAGFVVYDGQYHTGASATFPLTFDCSNDLALTFKDRVSSVDSNGACV